MGGDIKLTWGNNKILYKNPEYHTKPQLKQIKQSPKRLYKAPTELRKPQKD